MALDEKMTEKKFFSLAELADIQVNKIEFHKAMSLKTKLRFSLINVWVSPDPNSDDLVVTWNLANPLTWIPFLFKQDTKEREEVEEKEMFRLLLDDFEVYYEN